MCFCECEISSGLGPGVNRDHSKPRFRAAQQEIICDFPWTKGYDSHYTKRER